MKREPPTMWESFRLYVHLMGWGFRLPILVFCIGLPARLLFDLVPPGPENRAARIGVIVATLLIGGIVGQIIRMIGNVKP